MKLNFLIIGILYSANLISQNFFERIEAIPQCQHSLKNVTALSDGEIRYRRAVLSPNAESILLFGTDRTTIMDIRSREIIDRIDYYYEGQWVNDSLLIFRVKSGFKLVPLYQSTKKAQSPIPKLEFSETHRIISATNQHKEWTIADMADREHFIFYGLLFSNDFNKVLTHSNSGKEYVYHINGDGLIGIADIGLSCDWSDDDCSTISFLDLEFGQDYIVESDLYIQHIINDRECKLTDTDEILETWPSWSKNVVSFIDDKTDIVYVAEIVKREQVTFK